MVQRTTTQAELKPSAPAGAGPSGLVVRQFFLALLGLAVVLVLLWLGFLYLRGTKNVNILNALIAIIWGVGSESVPPGPSRRGAWRRATRSRTRRSSDMVAPSSSSCAAARQPERETWRPRRKGWSR